MLITNKKEKRQLLSQMYDKITWEGIRGTKIEKDLMHTLWIGKTSDNLYFVKNMTVKKITSVMVFKNVKDELNITLENFTKYHLDSNPTLNTYDTYYLNKNDNDFYTLATEKNDMTVREFTLEETEEINELVRHEKEKFIKRINKYWEKYYGIISSFSLIDKI